MEWIFSFLSKKSLFDSSSYRLLGRDSCSQYQNIAQRQRCSHLKSIRFMTTTQRGWWSQPKEDNDYNTPKVFMICSIKCFWPSKVYISPISKQNSHLKHDLKFWWVSLCLLIALSLPDAPGVLAASSLLIALGLLDEALIELGTPTLVKSSLLG